MSKPKVYIDKAGTIKAVQKLYAEYGQRAINSMNYYGVLEEINDVPPERVTYAMDKCREILEDAREKYKIPNPDGSKSEYNRGRWDAAREILAELRIKRDK